MSDNQSELQTIKVIFTRYSNTEIHFSNKITFEIIFAGAVL